MKSGIRALAAVVLAVSVTVPATLALAANEDHIAHRKALMQANRSVMGLVGKMAQGAAEFDQAAAIGALSQLSQTGHVLPAFFPDGSGEGETRAAPAIFSDREGFAAAAAKLATDADAAIAATEANGLEGLQASFQAVGSNCGACHGAYRTE